MADVNTTLAALERGRANCARLLLLVQEMGLNPSQAQVDLVVSTAADSRLTPRCNYALDGESYSWQGYQESLLTQVDRLTDLIHKLQGPWEVRSVGRG